MVKNLLFPLLFSFFTVISVFAGTEPIPLKHKFGLSETCDAPAPDSFRVTSAGGDFISLAWKPAWAGAEHLLSVSEQDASGGWLPWQIFPNVPDSTFTVDNLGSGKVYRFKITTKCPNGDPSSLTSSIDFGTLIVELTLAGRTPKNPSEVACTGITYKSHNWVGFMVSGEGGGNTFEVVVNDESISPIAYVKRVNTINPIVAVDPAGFFPTPFFPTIDDVPVPFGLAQLTLPEDIGAVNIVKNNGTIDICKADFSPLQWKNNYTLTILVAKETIIIPPGGGTGQGFGKPPTSNRFEIQNPFTDNLCIFVPKDFDTKSVITLSLYNFNGLIVKKQSFESFSSQLIFSVNELPSGMYILHIETDNAVQVFKVIKSE